MDLMADPGSERTPGTIACQETGGRCRGVRDGVPGDPRGVQVATLTTSRTLRDDDHLAYDHLNGNVHRDSVITGICLQPATPATRKATGKSEPG